MRSRAGSLGSSGEGVTEYEAGFGRQHDGERHGDQDLDGADDFFTDLGDHGPERVT